MRKIFLTMVLAAAYASGAYAWDGIKPSPEEVSAYRHIETLRQLAGEPAVVGDIRTQEIQKRDGDPFESYRELWSKSTGRSERVRPFLEKPSCQTMREYQTRNFSLVDCFTLDGEGRVVGELYKTPNFFHDQEPYFVNCFNGGQGKIFVGRPGPNAPGENHTVEISLPVLDGSKTIGVLVATLLLDK